MLTAQYVPFAAGTHSRWAEWRRVTTVALLLAVAVVTIESDLVPESNWAAESNLAQALPVHTPVHSKSSPKSKKWTPKTGVWTGGNPNYSNDPPWKQDEGAPFGGAKHTASKKGAKSKKHAKTKKAKKTKKALNALETSPMKGAMKALMKKQQRMMKKQAAAMKRANKHAQKLMRHQAKVMQRAANKKVKEVNQKTRKIAHSAKRRTKQLAKKARKERKRAQRAVKKAHRKAKKAAKKAAKKEKLAVKKAKAMAKAAAKSGPQESMMQVDSEDVDYDIAYDTELMQMLPSMHLLTQSQNKAQKKKDAKFEETQTMQIIHNIRELKAYCMAARNIITSDDSIDNNMNDKENLDALRKGPVGHLIMTFGKKAHPNILAEYAEIMGEMKHSYRQFRGYIVEHLDNAIMNGEGILKKVIGIKRQLVMKVQHKILGLTSEPAYFRMLAVPFPKFLQRADKVKIMSRHAALTAKVAWLKRHGKKRMARYLWTIHASDEHKENERRQKVAKAALRGIQSKWTSGKKLVPMAPHGLRKAEQAQDKIYANVVVPSKKAEKAKAKKKEAKWESKHNIKTINLIKLLEKKAGQLWA